MQADLFPAPELGRFSTVLFIYRRQCLSQQLSREDMAQDTKQSQVPMPCATGCGFYGSPRTNDMCSVCYKDSMQKQKSGERFSPPVTSVGSSGESLAAPRSESGASLPAPAFPLIDTVPEQNSVVSSQALSSQASVTLSEEHEPTVGKRGQKADELKAVAIADSDQSSVEGRVGSLDTPKTNRCFVCRKKLGFTGFGCRCGNVYCGSHRYSDVHNCTFDYKSDAAEKIRKENPVVVGEKINKI